MNENFSLDAISGVDDPTKIRVAIFINNRLVHAPLTSLVQHLTDQIASQQAQIDDLLIRVTALETP